MSKVFIVAEIGCNHNGDPALAKKWWMWRKNVAWMR
ncbi:nnab [Actinobacillus equuli]|nr:nnab [Actinobacillus equuli]VEI48614.1 nnab [Actinobacillus equuli]